MNRQIFENAPEISPADLEALKPMLSPRAEKHLTEAARIWAEVKQKGGKVVVATGSGPNLHEGVTTMIAEMVRLGLVDGVLTSSAVICHEMSGSLERVRRVSGERLGMDPAGLPPDGKVEVTLLSAESLERYKPWLDESLYRRMLALPGPEIIKVAGNLAYPSGWWIENLSRKIEAKARAKDMAFEAAAGMAADPRTMIGACAKREIPCLVTVPQLVGGGQVGLSLGDSISISRRSALVAKLLSEADLIIESGIALSQELHDGPFETYTGHGMWSGRMGHDTYSLKEKAVVRLDLDPAIEEIWSAQHETQKVANSIDKGLPKAEGIKAGFRMEMSGFARLPGALPITADLGVAWPLLADSVTQALGVKPRFMCYKQSLNPGRIMRDYIVSEIRPVEMKALSDSPEEAPK